MTSSLPAADSAHAPQMLAALGLTDAASTLAEGLADRIAEILSAANVMSERVWSHRDVPPIALYVHVGDQPMGEG